MSFSSARASKGAQEAAAIKPATTTRRVAAEVRTLRSEVIQIVTGVGDKHWSDTLASEAQDQVRERNDQICVRDTGVRKNTSSCEVFLTNIQVKPCSSI